MLKDDPPKPRSAPPTTSTRKGLLGYLTLAMVLILLLVPFLKVGAVRLTILTVLVSAVLALGIYVVSDNRRNLIIATVLGLTWFVLSWIPILFSVQSLTLTCISSGLLILFYGFTAVVILGFVHRADRVTSDVLFGAVATYMLIGGAFGTLYVMMEAIAPGSFAMASGRNPGGAVDFFDLLYFSYTTLTTLGYGDITPASAPAQAFAVVEAIMGVMYLAIIISRLVGLYIGQHRNDQR